MILTFYSSKYIMYVNILHVHVPAITLYNENIRRRDGKNTKQLQQYKPSAEKQKVQGEEELQGFHIPQAVQ